MFVLTEIAVLCCKHVNGLVEQAISQDFVTVERKRVLVGPDPESRPITGCPQYGPGIKPCTHTLHVTEGYSTFIRIGGHRICLDSVTGLTDGTPPGIVKYNVRTAGQGFVSSGE
jgi:hypothetical protein